MEAYGCGDGGLFGASGEAIGGVFNVAAYDDGAVFEEDCCAHAEVTVRGVGVLGGCGSLLLELLDQVMGKVGGGVRGHIGEANGWVPG